MHTCANRSQRSSFSQVSRSTAQGLTGARRGLLKGMCAVQKWRVAEQSGSHPAPGLLMPLWLRSPADPDCALDSAPPHILEVRMLHIVLPPLPHGGPSGMNFKNSCYATGSAHWPADTNKHKKRTQTHTLACHRLHFLALLLTFLTCRPPCTH